MRGPRTSLKRSNTRMNIDWRTTMDQEYNMPPQPTEPIGHMIQYSQLRLLETDLKINYRTREKFDFRSVSTKD